MALLELSDVSVRYGAIPALRDVDVHVEEGEIVALLGANGAGKTTTLRTISGLVHPQRGTIRFGELEIDQVPPHEVVALGIGHVPEGRRIFPRLSVMGKPGNGSVPAEGKVGRGFRPGLQYVPHPRATPASQDGGTLSGGEQQMLAIGRALMSRPHLLLLDEPSMGLAPQIVEAIFDIIVADPGLGGHGPSRRTKRRPGTGNCRPRVRVGKRPDSDVGPGVDAPRRRPCPAGVPR